MLNCALSYISSSQIIPDLYEKKHKAIEVELTKTQSLALTMDSW